MKYILLNVAIFFLAMTSLLAQPAIQWDSALGIGVPTVVINTADGGYLIGGSSNAGASEHKTEASRGEDDYWLVKVSAAGTREWDKTIGGTKSDLLRSVRQTLDGGYVLGGLSYSDAGGDKTQDNRSTPSPFSEIGDMWIVKLSPDGTIEWDRTLGGNNSDRCVSVHQTPDGSFIAAGYSDSDISGEKSQSRLGSYYDFWIVKLDAAGNKIWDKVVYPGNLRAVEPLQDGGMLMLGRPSETHIIRVSAEGELISDLSVPGLDYEATTFHQTADKGYILGGELIGDYRVTKIDADAAIQWDKTLTGALTEDPWGGAYGRDQLTDVVQTASGEYLVGGSSGSGAGFDKMSDNTVDKFESDIWLVKLAADGTKVWDKNVGGSSYDGLEALVIAKDGGLVLASYSFKEGVTGFDAGYWLVKLAPENPLPVILKTFSASKESETAALTWETTSETNSDHFEIQHSLDGKAWEMLAMINAQGESKKMSFYNYTHTTPVLGSDNLYRLKMVDADGTFAYSKIQHVKFEEDFAITVYPNPAVENIHLKAADWSRVKGLQILNNQGKMLYSAENKPSKDINARSLRPGLYFIKLTLVDGTETIRKIAVGQ
ncbi:T9SS type A sorting domain-containing protein [Dyadobacter sandarakinus]|uniref:T9SS type A sorting domain-containing protein n=1 Tax=Dyadobacter sandarakinus TaxID=2747268 RepID=A0ABX7I5S9_9BACT|nr:T9SS type A sorting domain-containing protein [Dyadobacter sandarakinus]QRR01457.1 T9SS type A sorting domain-containing protein [Dyadobacter sandarakinus]